MEIGSANIPHKIIFVLLDTILAENASVLLEEDC